MSPSGRGQQDPFALPLASPTDEFERRRMASSPVAGRPGVGVGGAGPTPGGPGVGGLPQEPGPPLGDSPLDRVGARTSSTLGAIDFPHFVAGLINGTFDAIVLSSQQQMRAFAEMVASLAQTVDEFAQNNVTPTSARDWLVESFPQELQILTPAPGSDDGPRLVPRRGAQGSSPAWLARFELAGQSLDEELTEGALVRAAQRSMAQRRMHQLSTLVLMGVNRIVIERGDITAKLQFHIEATDDARAAMASGQSGGATSGTGSASGSGASGSAARLSVSTITGNLQRDTSMRADLMGQVSVRFSTETFPLERFADSAAIQLINGHATPQRTASGHARREEPATAAPGSLTQPEAPATEPKP